MSTPSRFSSFVILGAVSVAAFALGWFGRGGAGPASPLPPPPDDAPRAAVVRSAKNADAAGPASGAAQQTLDTVLDEPISNYQRRLHLAQAVTGMDRAEVVAALEREHARAPTGSGGDGHNQYTEALLARFAELDPPAAVLWLVQTYRVDDIDSDWLAVTLDAWLEHDAKAALAWGQGLPAGSLRDQVNSELFEHMAVLDPAGTAQRISALSAKDSFSISSVFTRLAEKDLTAACAQAAQLPASRMEGAVEGIIEAWARRQPAEAYAWIAQIAPGSLHDAAAKQLYSTWAEQDPAAAAAFLTAHGGPDVGKYTEDLAGTWAKRDLAAARTWSEHLPPQMRRDAVAQVISAWSETDPRAATEYAMKLPRRQRESEVSTTVGQWAKRDLEAATAWMQQQPAGSDRRSALSAVCGVWTEQDPRACVEWLSKQAGDNATNQQRTQALTSWAERSPEEVWQWSQSVADVKRRGEAEAAALTALAGNDPAQAGARLAQLPAADQSDTASEVATKWAGTDSAAASLWAAGLAEGEARTSAVRSVAGTWAAYDAKAAAAWLNGQPAGDARDAGIEAIIQAQPDGMEPNALIHLAQSMRDPDTRKNTLENAAVNWLEVDRAKAQAWIDQSHLFTPEERTELLNRTGENSDGDDTDSRTIVTP